MSKPRKLVKKMHKFQDPNNYSEYTKIPLIPEVKLTVEQMLNDPIELLT